MPFEIARQVSEFISDTIQTMSENCALQTSRLFLNYVSNSSQRSSTLSAPSQLLEVKKGTLHTKNNVFVLYLAPLEGLIHNEKKKVRGQAPPQGAYLYSATTRWREATRCFLFQTIMSTTCVCVILSLSYLILGLLVCPRLQQQLHSCGFTIVRGPHKSSGAILKT